MSANLLRLFALLATMLLVAGCAMTRPPLQREKGYPAAWPDVSSLGVECKGLDGTYANQGIMIDGKWNPVPIYLSGILLTGKLAEAKTISLKVMTTHGKPDHDTFAKLLIDFGEGITNKLGSCFCIKHALMCTGLHRSSENIPYLLSASSQQNIWLTKATDGSLVAKIWESSVGFAAVVPFYAQSYVWARFQRVGD